MSCPKLKFLSSTVTQHLPWCYLYHLLAFVGIHYPWYLECVRYVMTFNKDCASNNQRSEQLIFLPETWAKLLLSCHNIVYRSKTHCASLWVINKSKSWFNFCKGTLCSFFFLFCFFFSFLSFFFFFVTLPILL